MFFLGGVEEVLAVQNGAQIVVVDVVKEPREVKLRDVHPITIAPLGCHIMYCVVGAAI